ncbi:MAG: HAD family hydrolase [Planctomycetes bacterium]|nr:HAD family hydrolase [Planctomycetota bacterium]
MRYECVIFDMDGTLTCDYLDFQAIRAAMGVPAGTGVLEAMAAMSPSQRARAERILDDHEMAAARNAPPGDGALEAVREVQGAGLATALLTRNSRRAMLTVIQRFGLTFDVTFSREDGPIKPSPQSIHEACGLLGVAPSRTACVGDWLFDIEAANAAGCTSILLARGRDLPFTDQADHVIESMWELPPILGL